jgi:hypothetical protein
LRKALPQASFTLEPAPDSAEQIASALTITDDKRVDVLIALLGVLHANIVAWTTRAHEAITWAVGITFGVVSFVFVSPGTVTVWSAIVMSTGLLVFGFMIHLYVRTARRAYSGNRLAVAKCEAALRMYEKGTYLHPQALFLYSKAMQTSQTLGVLSMIHAATVLLAIAFILARAFFK